MGSNSFEQMTCTQKNILILDPFLGKSHRHFWDNFKSLSAFQVSVFPFKEVYWKLASGLSGFTEVSEDVDLFFVSEYFDITSFKQLNPVYAGTPFLCYFHENQIEYPSRSSRDTHFILMNLRNYMRSDLNIFNSHWNRDSFLNGLSGFKRSLPSAYRHHVPSASKIKRDSDTVIYPGHNLSEPLANKSTGPLRIIWNHRWEYDKRPDQLMALSERIKDLDVELDVCGEFREDFERESTLKAILGDKLIHCGYYARVDDYHAALSRADVVLSTAAHEFYGISVLEAILYGAYPLLPRSLSYPELYLDCLGEKIFYDNMASLEQKIKDLTGEKKTGRLLSIDHMAKEKLFEDHCASKIAAQIDMVLAKFL